MGCAFPMNNTRKSRSLFVDGVGPTLAASNTEKKLSNIKKNPPNGRPVCDAVVTDGTWRHSTVGGGKERGEGVGSG